MNFTYSASYRNSSNVSVKTGESMITFKSSEGDGKNSYTFYKKWNKSRVDLSLFKTAKKQKVILALPEQVCIKNANVPLSFTFSIQFNPKLTQITDTENSIGGNPRRKIPLKRPTTTSDLAEKLKTGLRMLFDSSFQLSLSNSTSNDYISLKDLLEKDLTNYQKNILGIPASSVDTTSISTTIKNFVDANADANFKKFSYIFTLTSYETLLDLKCCFLIINEFIKNSKLTSISETTDNNNTVKTWDEIEKCYTKDLADRMKRIYTECGTNLTDITDQFREHKFPVSKLSVVLTPVTNKVNALLPSAEVYVKSINYKDYELFDSNLYNKTITRKEFVNNWMVWNKDLNTNQKKKLVNFLFRYFYKSTYRDLRHKAISKANIPEADWQIKIDCIKKVNEFVGQFSVLNFPGAWLTHKVQDLGLVKTLNLTDNEIRKLSKELSELTYNDEENNETKAYVTLDNFNTFSDFIVENYEIKPELSIQDISRFPSPPSANWEAIELQALKIRFSWTNWDKGPYKVDLYGKRNKTYSYQKYLDYQDILTGETPSDTDILDVNFSLAISTIDCTTSTQKPDDDTFTYPITVTNTSDNSTTNKWIIPSLEFCEVAKIIAPYIVASSTDSKEICYTEDTVSGLVKDIIKSLKVDCTLPTYKLRKGISISEAQSIKGILSNVGVVSHILYPHSYEFKDFEKVASNTEKQQSEYKIISSAYLGQCNKMVATLKKLTMSLINRGYLHKPSSEKNTYDVYERIPESLRNNGIYEYNTKTKTYKVKPGSVIFLVLEPKQNLMLKYYLVDDITNLLPVSSEPPQNNSDSE